MFNAEGCSSQNQLSCTTSNINYGNNTMFINNSIFLQGDSFRTFLLHVTFTVLHRASSFMYRGADKSLARPISRCTFFDGENI